MTVENCLQSIESRVAEACRRSGRKLEDVTLLAVSKRQPTAKLKRAIELGHKVFGENYVKEAEEKLPIFNEADCEVHLIGPLQSNKAKKAVSIFDVIESVHSLKIARELNKAAAKIKKVQRVLLQVNCSGESSKSGVSVNEVATIVSEIRSLEHLSLEGLMVIGEYIDPSEPPELRARDFVTLRQLREDINNKLDLWLPHLSMGMSHDFELAIEHGATIVRVGSAIFGERP